MVENNKKILVTSGPAIAHLTRPLSVANKLRDHGVDILVATEDRPWCNIVHSQGYNISHLPTIVDSAALRQGSLSLSYEMAQDAVRADLDLLDSYKPSLVLLDWRPSMRLAAAIRGIPVIAIVNVHVTRFYKGPLAAPEKHPLTRLFGQKLADKLMPVVSPIFYRLWSKPFRRLAKEFNFQGWSDYRDYLTGNKTLYPDLPSLAPSVPNSGTYVGPLIHYPLPVEPISNIKSPVLYISFGSDIEPDDSTALINAVNDWPGSIIVTRGGGTTKWPSHWISVDYANPADLLKHSSKLVWLYHGGNGTSYQLLWHWYKDKEHCGSAIAVPFNVEQHWNATKLFNLGIVYKIFPAHTLSNTEQLCHSIKELGLLSPPLIPKFLSDEIDLYSDSANRAAEEVLQWMS